MLRLPRLSQAQKIVNPDGTPTAVFQQYIQQFAQQIETSVNGIQAALDAADVANAAAAAAQTAADTAQDAADSATGAATSAQGAADAANSTLADIQTGDFDISAIKVGGQRFVNDGGVLQLE